jgi:ketol-acid reductoisomerase
MARIFHDSDAPLTPLEGKRVAVIGYGNQGRAWALNLRDSKVDVLVGTVADASRRAAQSDGFEAHEVAEAVAVADVVCLLIPDEVMGEAVSSHIADALKPGAVVIFASGYAVAFDEVALPDSVDIGLVAPRMIGVGVRDSYMDGSGFIAFAGVERDATGNALPVTLAIANALGATRRGSVEMTCAQEALIDLFVEQGIAPALQKVWRDAAMVLLEGGIPIEAVLAEFYLSGEIERTTAPCASSAPLGSGSCTRRRASTAPRRVRTATPTWTSRRRCGSPPRRSPRARSRRSGPRSAPPATRASRRSARRKGATR